MSEDREFQRVKWLLGAGVVFLISAFMSLDEFRYSLWGKTTEGRVLRTKQTTSSGRSSGPPALSVEYSFTDEKQGPLVDSALVSSDSYIPPEIPIPIQYIPGSSYSSRILGQTNRGWVYIFFGSLAIMALFLWKLAREANEPPSRGRVRRLR